MRKTESSYQLLSGERSIGVNSRRGSYNGAYVDDYEYVAASDDLDECNGMTVNGVYGLQAKFRPRLGEKGSAKVRKQEQVSE